MPTQHQQVQQIKFFPDTKEMQSPSIWTIPFQTIKLRKKPKQQKNKAKQNKKDGTNQPTKQESHKAKLHKTNKQKPP